MQLKEPKLSSIDLVFRAFSDRTRLRILNLLHGKDELCVCDIIRVIGAPQAKISRHLAYLRGAGLVAGRKQGLWVYYRLLPASSSFHRKMLECLACCLADVPELKQDRAKLNKCQCKADQAGACCP
jgi:ArsR family transcriptional regulator